jgi:3-oxoacyl-[acyl-carrier protein] reductase
MDLGIKGKIALVTAASKGLGKAVAKQLAREDATVIISARKEKDLKTTCDEIRQQTGKTVSYFVCDVTREEEVQKMIQDVVSQFGGLDILICNAGGPPSGLIEDFGLDDYRHAFELNLLSTINLCNLCVPVMKKKQWGRIVVITSVSVKQPLDSLVLSNTARAGATGYLKTLSNLVAADGITVNAVCPGYTKTHRVENLAKAFAEQGKGTIEEFYEKLEKDIPMKRIGNPEEFGQVVAFLTSQGAGYITGVSLQVDGGFVKGLF